MSKLRVGFIGCGRISDLHALAYKDNPDAEIYGVCDTQEEVARRRAGEWGAARWCTDYRDVLADEAVDAVEILTPHHLHAEMTLAAVEAGKLAGPGVSRSSANGTSGGLLRRASER